MKLPVASIALLRGLLKLAAVPSPSRNAARTGLVLPASVETAPEATSMRRTLPPSRHTM